MDYGHEQTDKMLKDLEKRIQKEYSQAAREVEASMNKWLAQYRKNDDKMRALWKSGDITKKEYTDWRKKQIMLSDKWKAQRDELTQRMMEADKVASGLITDHKMEVYALNYNYGTYEVEKGARIDTGFSLYNKDTVARLMKDDPKLLPPPGKKTSDKIRKGELKRWNNKQVQSVMTQGILQGESIPKISKRLAVTVGEKNAYSHHRAARTMTTSAENAGRMDSYKRAEGMGIKMGKTWLAAHDNHTRKSHRLYDGMTIPLKDEFATNLMFPGDPDADPAEIYNCFVGDTLVATDSDIVRSYKHEYKGELVTIETAAGVKFTCTLNHPILTPSGWVRANRLNKGDDICVTFVGDHHLPRRYPNVNHIHSRIDALHEFANKFGRERVSGLRVNFHGDVPATDVEVITHKGLLSDNRNAGEFEEKRKLGFKFSNSTLFSHGTLMKHIRRVGTSAFCFVCGACEALSFFLRGLRHSEIHRLRPIALLDASGMKPMKNNLSGYAEFFRKRLHGASTVVFADNIISVNYSTDCTHVYNLQSDSGYYFVNSIISKNGGMYNGIGAIVHNCRCTMIADVLSVDGIDLSDIGRGAWADNWNMDYDEWKHALDEKATNAAPKAQTRTANFESRKLQQTLGSDYNDFKNTVQKSDTAGMYTQYADECRSYTLLNSGGRYSPAADAVQFSYESHEGMSKYSTVAHEIGHMFDSKIGRADFLHFAEADLINSRCVIGSGLNKAIKITPSMSDEFLGAIRKDMSVLEKMVKNKSIREEFLSSKAMRNSTSGIQDALDGFFGTQGKGLLPWGHGDRYYNRAYNRRFKDMGLEKDLKQAMLELGFDASNQTKVKRLSRTYEAASEAWANVASAITCGGAELEAMEKYMPETVKAFREIARRY